MLKPSLILILLFFCYTLFSQVKTTTGESQIEISKDLSRNELEKKATQLAIVDAIEKAFGRVIFQGNSTYISNFQSGEKVESSSAFNMIGNTYVKGECLEILQKDFEEVEGKKIIDNKMTEYKELKCTVKIKAREIKIPPIEFQSNTLSKEDKSYVTTTFKNKQPLYFYFQSPVNGYLNIFLDDTKNTYRLYPYKDMPAEYLGGAPVASDKEYILFSTEPEFNYYNNQFDVPGKYIMVTDTKQELNRLFVVFSKEPLNKPHFNKKIKDELTTDELSENLDIPDGLESEEFQKWLQKNRYIRDDIQLKIIDIAINGK